MMHQLMIFWCITFQKFSNNQIVTNFCIDGSVAKFLLMYLLFRNANSKISIIYLSMFDLFLSVILYICA